MRNGRPARQETSGKASRIGSGRALEQTVVKPSESGLGTFGGVFTPSVLTILGVIMYLRFGWVVGNAGLIGTLVIVTVSTLITFLTGLSISAIATDQRVRVGGAYYMISRSLGIESGGAVGIPLYFAQALSVALYTVGFAESVSRVFPVLNEKLVAIVTTVLVALVAIRSAESAIRAQYFIMGAIAISLLSLVFGREIEPTSLEWTATVSSPVPFWTVFAVFFPAVTGIMAGVNMSGDLRNPSRSIPRGTLLAIAVGFLIYMGLPLLLAMRAGPEALAEDPLIMRRIAFWGDAILLGVWGATLSSAVGSILGAPRVLQALARDGVLPRQLRWLRKGSGSHEEPRIGTVVTMVVALIAVALGNLNIIAPILTMFFLTTYGVLNIAAGIERFLENPSFRPTFKVHWVWSLLGAVGCALVMFLISAWATVIAIVVVLAIFIWLERRELETTWGDIRRGVWMALTRAGLLHLQGSVDPKNWRPHLLVLSGAPTSRWHLIEMASDLTHNRALLTVATILQSENVSRDRLETMETSTSEYLAKRGVQALVRIVCAPDAFIGAKRLVETYGMGQLMPNTVLLGMSEQKPLRERYSKMIAGFYTAHRNVAILSYNEARGFGRRRQIDVWWGGLRGNGGLMLLLADLLRTSVAWRGAHVRLKMIVPAEEAREPAEQNLYRIISQSRLGAVPEVIVGARSNVEHILKESSRRADLVFLGMAEPGSDFDAYLEQTLRRARDLPTAIFVLASEELEFREVMMEAAASI